MGLNVENTNKAIERFKEYFENDHYNGKIVVHDHTQHGAESVEAIIEKPISLRELEDLKEGIHNTMSVGIDKGTGKLFVSIW